VRTAAVCEDRRTGRHGRRSRRDLRIPMRVARREQAPRYTRDEGITSYLLVSPRTSDAEHLTTTLVEIEAGGEQRVHSHLPEQIYFIMLGSGVMSVGEETRTVTEGDCILVPSGAPHGLRNSGTGVLRYFSAAAPSFTAEQLRKWWPLESDQ
jgi:mannose-6-phosphate isomerase-like protein (cupin superfamily)